MSEQSRVAVWRIIGLAACLGALVGVFVRPTWTDNLIGAQILAGLVEYPPDSIMPTLYLRPHSVLTQLAALPLMVGVPEWHVALIFSAVQGAVGCAALSALTLVFVPHRWAALFVPLLLLRFGESLPMWPGDYLRVFHGHVYPNTFPVGPGVFGVVGMFTGLLALGLMGLNRRRGAALLLGVMPVVHAGLVLPFLGAVGVVAWVGRERLRGEWPTLWQWFGVGATVSLLSTLVYLTYVPMSPAFDGALASSTAGLTQWLLNDHMRALSGAEWLLFWESEVYTAILAMALLTWLKREVNDAARAMVWVVVVITLAAAVYTVVAEWVPALVPWQVQALLVRRWLNVSSWFFPVAALGLLCRLAVERGRREAVVMLAVLALLVWGRLSTGITIASGLQAIETATSPWTWVTWLRMVGLVFPLVLVGGALTLWRREQAMTDPARIRASWVRVARVLLVVGWVLPFRNASWSGQAGAGTCQAVMAQARSGQGTLLLGADLWEAEWIQARTRRPVLFEAMDLNILPFSPSVAPRVEQILEQAYGRTAAEGLVGRLDDDWPGFDAARWTSIARQFRVTQTLVTSDVSLQLPLVLRDDGCALYQMPELP